MRVDVVFVEEPPAETPTEDVVYRAILRELRQRECTTVEGVKEAVAEALAAHPEWFPTCRVVLP